MTVDCSAYGCSDNAVSGSDRCAYHGGTPAPVGEPMPDCRVEGCPRPARQRARNRWRLCDEHFELERERAADASRGQTRRPRAEPEPEVAVEPGVAVEVLPAPGVPGLPAAVRLVEMAEAAEEYAQRLRMAAAVLDDAAEQRQRLAELESAA